MARKAQGQAGRGGGERALLILATVVVIVAGLRVVEPILTPIVLAALVALIITPIEQWLRRRGLPRWAAMLLVVLVSLGVLGALSALVAQSVTTLQERLPEYENGFRREIGAFVDGTSSLAARLGIDLQESDIKRGLDPGMVFTWARTGIIVSGNLLSNTLFVLVLAAFMLGEATILPKKLQVIRSKPGERLQVARDFRQSVLGYVQIKAVTSAATGILAGGICALFGVDFAVLWGVLAFGMNFVPNIGSILAAVPPVALGFVLGGVQEALFLAGAYLVINVGIGTILEPRLMGKRVGLSTLVVVLSLVFWGWVLGPVGMLLSIPLTMVVKLAVDQSEDLRWVGVLLGSEPADAPTDE
jgi:AI-2 transport protein TqsA